MNRTKTHAAARFAALAVGVSIGLGATTAAAAEPAATQPVVVQPAPAPAPASTTVTTVPNSGGGQPVIVVNTNVPVAQPAPAPTWQVEKVEPTPAPPPAPVFPDRIHVELHGPTPAPPPTIAVPPPPTAAERARLQKVADKSRARSLMVAGWATLGSTYAFSALTGTIAIDTARNPRMRNYGAWMTIPVAGPFAAAFYTRTATGGLLTTALGVAQGGGLLMALVGGARHRRLKRELSFAFAPTGDGGGQVGVTGRF